MSSREQKRAKSAKPKTRYTETGNAFRFDSDSDALRIDLVGPFGSTDHLKEDFAPEVQSTRVLARSDFLNLGLDQSTALNLRKVQHTRETQEFAYRLFSIGSRPFSEEAIAKYHSQQSSFAYTEAEERAAAACSVAYDEFFQIAARTPALRAILMKVAKFSVMRTMLTGRFNNALTFVLPRIERYNDLGISGADNVYSEAMIISLNKQPLIYMRVLLTQPKLPLQNTAGIYGFVAASPTKPTERVVMRILGGQRGRLPEAPGNE